MATNNYRDEALRNPAVDYERADLSPRGILLFLVGLLVCGIFIELVIWGMFHFLRNSEGIFAQGQTNPMLVPQKPAPETMIGSKMQNTPPEALAVFPAPRLQVNDAAEMAKFLASQQKVLNPEQPFTDPTGAIHIPISDAMKLVEQRLPVRPNAPPADLTSQEGAGTGPTATGQDHVPGTSTTSAETTKNR